HLHDHLFGPARAHAELGRQAVAARSEDPGALRPHAAGRRQVTASLDREPSSPMRWRLISLSIAAAVIALVIGANAHLVYVAFVSQPDCVPHAGDAGSSGTFRAAEPSC